MSTGANDPLLAPSSDSAAGAVMRDLPEAYYGEEEAGGIDVRRYLSAILRYKWLILGLAAIGLAAGVALSRYVKKIYEAQAMIQIEVAPRNAPQSGPIRTTQLLEARAWIDLLRSFRVLDEVVRRRRLFIEPEVAEDSPVFSGFLLGTPFTPGTYRLTVNSAGTRVSLLTEEGELLDGAAVGDSLGRALGFQWVPAELRANRTVNFIVSSPRDAAVQLSEALLVPQLSTDGSFLRMSMRGTDPVAIAATINAVAERFVEVAAFLKRDKLSQVTEVLRAQLERSSADLHNAENAFETFKINTITLPSDRGATQIASGLTETRDPVRVAFFKLRIDRDSLAQERDAIERALAVAPDSNLSLVIVLGTIESVNRSSELSTALSLLASKRSEARMLRLAFGPSSQALRSLDSEILELEQNIIPAQAKALASNLSDRIQDFDARIAASAREMQEIPARASEEARLQRNVTVAENLYTALQTAYEQARLAELSSSPDVRVLDGAEVPTQPVTDRLLMIIAGGFAAGLAFGVALAVGLDRIDRRIRYPEQVTRDLGLSILGALPMLEYGKSGKPKPEQASQLLEALRTIRMNLGYTHGAAGPFITTVTSPGAGDGKSFLAANLAKAFADAGRRTLLLDADTRRGVQHRTMEVPRKPGLLDYLSGTATREQMIRPIPAWGVDFIPCGTRKSGGPELLASPVMAQLLMGLRTEYQVIIIDSPPIGAGVDPLLLASLCGSMVMVLRTGVTDRELAESRLHDLQRLPIRVLGAVLNDVKPEGIYRYYAYLPGYRSEDEVQPEEELTPKAKRLSGSAR